MADCKELPSLERVKKLENDNNKLKNDVNTLKNKLNDLASKIDNLPADDDDDDDEKEDTGDDLLDRLERILPVIIEQVTNAVLKRFDSALRTIDKIVAQVSQFTKLLNQVLGQLRDLENRLSKLEGRVTVVEGEFGEIRTTLNNLIARFKALTLSPFLSLRGNILGLRISFNGQDFHTSVSLSPALRDVSDRVKREIEPLINKNRLRSVNLALSSVPSGSGAVLSASLIIADSISTLSTRSQTFISIPSSQAPTTPTPLPRPQEPQQEEIIIVPRLDITKISDSSWRFTVSVNGRSSSASLSIEGSDDSRVKNLIDDAISKITHDVRVEHKGDRRYEATVLLNGKPARSDFTIASSPLSPSLVFSRSSADRYTATIDVGGESSTSELRLQLDHDVKAEQKDDGTWDVSVSLNGTNRKANLDIADLNDLKYVTGVTFSEETNTLSVLFNDGDIALIELLGDDVDLEELKEFIKERTALVKPIYRMLGGVDWYGTINPDEDAIPSLIYNYEEELKTQVGSIYSDPIDLKNGVQVETNSFIQHLARLTTVSFARSGHKEYPLTVPSSFSDESKGTEEIEDDLGVAVWMAKQLDSLMGAFPIEIEIEDNDLIQTGNQKLELKFPNLGEAVAELLGQTIIANAKQDALIATSMRALGETGSALQVLQKNHAQLAAISTYLGFKLKQKKQKLKLLHNPVITETSSNKESLSEALEPTEVDVVIEEYDDNDTLERHVAQLLHFGSITKAANFRTVENGGALKTILKEGLQLIKDVDLEGDGDFDKFTQKVEIGFESDITTNETGKPYGRPFEQRPRIRDFGDDEINDG